MKKLNEETIEKWSIRIFVIALYAFVFINVSTLFRLADILREHQNAINELNNKIELLNKEAK